MGKMRLQYVCLSAVYGSQQNFQCYRLELKCRFSKSMPGGTIWKIFIFPINISVIKELLKRCEATK